MLEQLTSLAKLDVVDASAFRTLDLETIAGDSVAALAPYVFESGRTLEFVADPQTNPIRGVPALIENTISNLVGNAVKHTPKGTHITVRAAAPAVLEVTDTGPASARRQPKCWSAAASKARMRSASACASSNASPSCIRRSWWSTANAAGHLRAHRVSGRGVGAAGRGSRGGTRKAVTARGVLGFCSPAKPCKPRGSSSSSGAAER